MESLTLDTVTKLFKFAMNVPGQKTWWITRLSMYKALKNRLASEDREERNCLAISSSVEFGRNVLGLKKCTYTQANYPEQNLLSLRFPDSQFDFCISDQVLEHVEGNPFKAFSESSRVIKPGGYVCHTTCFINGIHKTPGDFWRFTPDALRLMAKEAGLEPIIIGGWGNREVMSILASPELRYEGIPDDPNNPVYQLALKNDEDWPISVWIIARKPVT
jgi:SAM-dependent methyltransferase